jgi:hypothetical protein
MSDLFVETTMSQDRRSSVGATQPEIRPSAANDQQPAGAAPPELEQQCGARGSYKQGAPDGASSILATAVGRMKNARKTPGQWRAPPLWLVANRGGRPSLSFASPFSAKAPATLLPRRRIGVNLRESSFHQPSHRGSFLAESMTSVPASSETKRPPNGSNPEGELAEGSRRSE